MQEVSEEKKEELYARVYFCYIKDMTVVDSLCIEKQQIVRADISNSPVVNDTAKGGSIVVQETRTGKSVKYQLLLKKFAGNQPSTVTYTDVDKSFFDGFVSIAPTKQTMDRYILKDKNGTWNVDKFKPANGNKEVNWCMVSLMTKSRSSTKITLPFTCLASFECNEFITNEQKTLVDYVLNDLVVEENPTGLIEINIKSSNMKQMDIHDVKRYM